MSATWCRAVWRRALGHAMWRRTLGATLLACAAGVQAQLSISDSGLPVYSAALAVPPGISGMVPNIGITYTASSVNGPLGYGWTLQGISVITRCPQFKAVDGIDRGVQLLGTDKLCLDGERLIQTDANGVASPSQTGDSLGGTGLVREYRTEKDSFARIRAYGSAGGNAANGPAYFRVWTKSGQMHEYGNNANATANANINAQGNAVIVAWPASRISDTLGNYIDFQYEQRDVAWGSGPTAGSPTPGHEWNLVEIRYTGKAAQVPVNRVVFSYSDRPDNPGGAQDRSEAYNQGSKNVSIRRLDAVRTYTNWPANVAPYPAAAPATALKVKITKLTYDQGPITKRSRIVKLQECVGAAEDKCLPATTFSYTAGGNEAFTRNTAFNLTTEPFMNTAGNVGPLIGDFNGDGLTDLIKWSDTPAQNKLWLGSTTGAFTVVAAGAGAGQFNITDQNLGKSNGCFQTIPLDFDGDGATDLLRAMTGDPATCGAAINILYLSKGDGSFTASTLPPAIDLRRITGTDMPKTVKTFHLIDVNGDGRLDIITAIYPSYTNATVPNDATVCASITCSRVFVGQVGGTFTEVVNTNIKNRSVFDENLDGLIELSSSRRDFVQDINGDGLADLNTKRGVWISNGDGNFTFSPPGPATEGCARPIDFNADGRSDCIYAAFSGSGQSLRVSDGMPPTKLVAGFNLINAGQELIGFGAGFSIGVGVEILDGFDSGKPALLRWNADPTKNALYVSNGDGTFRSSASFNLITSSQLLRDGNLTANFITGDFTGRGQDEILRFRSNPTAASEASGNQLYTRANTEPADMLSTVTSGSGLVSRLTWVSLANSASGSLGARYRSDRSDLALRATFPVTDLTPASYVVASLTVDTGAGSSQLTTEFGYAGLKAARDGRGLLGFRETLRQSTGANGDPLTVRTRNLQSYPYLGAAYLTETYTAPLNAVSGSPISRTEYTYCENSVAANAGLATPQSPCMWSSTPPLLKRPFLYRSVEQGSELAANGGAALPTVTTINTFNATGDPTQIAVSVAGTAAGVSQSSTRTTTNTYLTPDTSGDNWILGRLQASTQANSVTNSLGTIVASPGSAPQASATQGAASSSTLTPPAFPAVGVGQSTSAVATLLNTGVSALSLTVPTATSVSGLDFGFGGTTCGTILLAGASCTVTVNFAPTALASRSGTLTIATESGSKLANFTATAAAQTASISSVAFGNRGVSTQTDLTATITNTSSTVALGITVPAAGSVSGTDFSFVSTTCGASLAASGTCTVTVRFAPTAVVARTGTLTVATGAGSQVSNLTGTGVQSFITATGGTITTSGNYRIHTFTGSGTLSISQAPAAGATLEYLVVGGGGGGGCSNALYGGGGGGAGGYLTGSRSINSTGSVTVTVGTGGAGDTNARVVVNPGTNGGNSAMSGTVFGTTVTAVGGGKGVGTASGAGAAGGSGGGASSTATPAAGTAGQGYAAGRGTGSIGGGGGGAGGAGSNGSGIIGGNGGPGVPNSISGTAVTYAPGGKGGGLQGGAPTTPTEPGGGGLGATSSGLYGGNGASGIVIVRYLYQ